MTLIWRVGEQVTVSWKEHALYGEHARITRVFDTQQVVEITLPDGRTDLLLFENVCSKKEAK